MHTYIHTCTCNIHSLSLYVSVYIIYICICAYLYMYTYIHLYIYVYTYMYIYTYVCMYMYVYIYGYKYIYMCVCVCLRKLNNMYYIYLCAYAPHLRPILCGVLAAPTQVESSNSPGAVLCIRWVVRPSRGSKCPKTIEVRCVPQGSRTV